MHRIQTNKIKIPTPDRFTPIRAPKGLSAGAQLPRISSGAKKESGSRGRWSKAPSSPSRTQSRRRASIPSLTRSFDIFLHHFSCSISIFSHVIFVLFTATFFCYHCCYFWYYYLNRNSSKCYKRKLWQQRFNINESCTSFWNSNSDPVTVGTESATVTASSKVLGVFVMIILLF